MHRPQIRLEDTLNFALWTSSKVNLMTPEAGVPLHLDQLSL